MLYGDEGVDLTTQELEKLEEKHGRIRSPDHSYDPLTRRVSVRAWPENTACSMDWETGEILCKYEKNVPSLDCRQPWCLHRREMVARTRRRLTHLGYAPGDGTGAGLWLSQRATEAKMADEFIESAKRASTPEDLERLKKCR